MRNDYDHYSDAGHSYGSQNWNEAGAQSDNDGQVSMLVLLTDRLSGRWTLAICLAVVLGLAGLIVGWYQSETLYRSEALIRIDPQTEVTRQALPDHSIKFYGQYLKTQSVLIKSHRVLAHALTMDGIRDKPYFQGANGLTVLRDGLQASTSSDTQLILVSFTAPTGVLAEAGVNAVVRSYNELYGRAGVIGMGRKIQDLRDDVATQERRLRPLESQIASIHAKYHTNELGALVIARHQFVEEIKTRIEEAVAILSARELSGADQNRATQVLPTASEKELEKYDEHLASLRSVLDSSTVHFERIKDRYRPGARQYTWAEERLASAKKLYERQLKIVHGEWMADNGIDQHGFSTVGILENPEFVKWSPEQLAGQLELWKAELSKEEAASEAVMEDAREINDLSSLVATIRADIATTNARIRALSVEEDSIGGRVEIQLGIVPLIAASDKRGMRALTGLVGGAFVGFFIVFLIGCFDRRTTTAYHVGSSSLNIDAGCLGVLPDLNQARDDVDGADVASHCVHQVRNQIEAIRNPRQGFVVTITSPFQGDGKTSVVMSLGWSYAAAGYRTVVVDCDLVGRSMTRQMGLVGAPGVKEVIRSHHVNGEIRELDNKNLSILPVGVDPAVGPESIRKLDVDELFNSLRSMFDIILVDTGPITGSLESTPVSVAADGVIMVIRSGGSRTRLEEGLGGLQRYGVRYLGTILNCAPYDECYRYVSEASLSAAAEARGVIEGQVEDASSVLATTKKERSPLMLAMETSSRSRDDDVGSKE